ncbi:MAG: hypothetical protein OEY28_11270, partial [Nitrospira sp.]|nr:hypothetical protein [Nitrospira sp.]
MTDRAVTAIIPFSTSPDDTEAARLARGLAMELRDWLIEQGHDAILMASAKTEDDSAWRRLVSYTDDLDAETACEIVEMARMQAGRENDKARMVLSGRLDLERCGSGDVISMRVRVDVTDAAAILRRGSCDVKLVEAGFEEDLARVSGEAAALAVTTIEDGYRPGTASFKAWVQFLLLREAALAAELGALDGETTDDEIYTPALEATRLDPGLVAVRDRLADLCEILVRDRGRDPGLALKALGKVADRVGEGWRSLQTQGALHTVAGEHSKAAKAFVSVMVGKHQAESDEDRLRAALEAGRSFNRAGRHVEAQRVLRAAMRSEELKADAIVESANASASVGELIVAQRLFERALEIAPGHVLGRYNLALIYRIKGEERKAAKQFERMTRLENVPREFFADAVEFFASRRSDKGGGGALLVAQRFADAWPGEALAHIFHASALNKVDRRKDALAALERAELCSDAGRYNAMLTRQRRAAEHPESEAELRVAATAALEGDPEEGYRKCEALLELHGDFPEAEFFRAVASRRLDRWEEAKDAFEELASSSELPGIDKELTGIYAHLGDKDASLAAAQRAYEADPGDGGVVA